MVAGSWSGDRKGAGGRHHRRTLTGASSGDDEPLEMSMRLTRKSEHPQSQSEHQQSEEVEEAEAEEHEHEHETHAPKHIEISTANSFDDTYSIPPTPYTPGPHSPEAYARDHPLGRRGSSAPSRSKSLVSLGSEDDLLGRRMRGLVTGLTRVRSPGRA